MMACVCLSHFSTFVTLFLLFLCFCNYTVAEMVDDIDRWRKNAKANGIPFFVFSIMRDPLGAYISIFNFFCAFLGKAGHVDCKGAYDVNHMIEVSPDNPQSRWMCYATTLMLGSRYESTKDKTIDECGDLIGMLKRGMDWIGILSRFTDTIKLFELMGINLGNAKKNVKKGAIKKKDLSLEAMKVITTKLTHDEHMLSWVETNYTLAKFGYDPDVDEM